MTSASICVRCPVKRIRKRNGIQISRRVPVSMVLNDESLCPTHFMEKADELGITLKQAIGCWCDD